MALLASITLVMPGCRTTDAVEAAPDGTAVIPPAQPFAERWAEVTTAQARRLQALDQFYASGQIELRWRDEKGNHFEYGRGEFFFRAPDETALSLTKVGERFLWVGSAGGARWMFDLRERAPTLWLIGGEGPIEGAVEVVAASSGPLDLRRLSLVDALGLFPLPAAEDLDAVLDDGDPIVVEFEGDGGPLRVSVDAATRRPQRVEVLDDEGLVVLRSDLARFEPVDRPGRPPGNRPTFPNSVLIETADDAADRQEVRLFLEPDPRGETRIVDRLFQLDGLVASLRPVRVVRP